MSISAAQADAFYREALQHETVWSIRDARGFPAPETPEGRAMPFWSSKARATRIVEAVPAYRGFEVVSIPLADWRSRWLPGLERDGVRAGLNWSGSAVAGYDISPEDVERNLSARDRGR